LLSLPVGAGEGTDSTTVDARVDAGDGGASPVGKWVGLASGRGCLGSRAGRKAGGGGGAVG